MSLNDVPTMAADVAPNSTQARLRQAPLTVADLITTASWRSSRNTRFCGGGLDQSRDWRLSTPERHEYELWH
jgi:hypothetical protein